MKGTFGAFDMWIAADDGTGKVASVKGGGVESEHAELLSRLLLLLDWKVPNKTWVNGGFIYAKLGLELFKEGWPFVVLGFYLFLKHISESETSFVTIWIFQDVWCTKLVKGSIWEGCMTRSPPATSELFSTDKQVLQSIDIENISAKRWNISVCT